MQTIHYPIKGRKIREVITQRTLDMLIAQWENWQQGPGVIGRLNLHSCWGTASVLDRGYQGETVTIHALQMRVVRRLYEQTRNPKWKVMLDSMASHLLYLQDKSGGFIHATAEFEPTFDTRGCPIHFFHPIIALCEYYMWEYADENIKALIPGAVDRQWEWSLTHSWKVGNGFKRPLPFPGWCGVTNQDFVAIGAIVMTMKAFGDLDPKYAQRYEEYGKPTLDYYLSPAYYHEAIGLFERGDGKNFAERTVYYTHILEMLMLIGEAMGDDRLIAVYDNVVDHIFDAVFVHTDGLTYLARGAITDPEDKTFVKGWEYNAIAFDHYVNLMKHMRIYLSRHPSEERSAILERLHDTIAAYVYEDGSIPLGMFNPNPLFSVVTNPDNGWYIEFVMDVLGDDLADPQPVEMPCIHRISGDITWKQKGALWAIEEKGERKYGGFSRFPGGVVSGTEAKPVWGSFDALENPDVIETIDVDDIAKKR